MYSLLKSLNWCSIRLVMTPNLPDNIWNFETCENLFVDLRRGNNFICCVYGANKLLCIFSAALQSSLFDLLFSIGDTTLWCCLLNICVSVSDPPDATITTSSSRWYVGLEKAELVCEGRGHPTPQNFTWTWYFLHFHIHICHSGSQQHYDDIMLNPTSPLSNTIYAANVLFTWHWNVTQNIDKPLLTRIHMEHTPANNKGVRSHLKGGGVPILCWLKSLLNKRCGVALRNFKLEDCVSHEGGSERHKEEQETHAKRLIIVPCFKYHSNAW